MAKENLMSSAVMKYEKLLVKQKKITKMSS